MYAVSDRFLETVAGTHQAVVRAVLVNGRQFGPTPSGVELPILTGDVKFATDADVKATLDITIPGDYWNQVQPYAGEIWVARGVSFGDGTSELVPLGYFRIDETTQDSAPYGPVQIAASDRITAIQQNRVLFPYQVPDGTTHRTIFERLVNGRVTPDAGINTAGYAALATVAVPITWTAYDPDRATVNGGQVVEDSTYDFLSKLADNKGCVLRFDENGELQVELRDPDPDAPTVYAILPGQTGNLVKASRKANRDGVYNIVSAYGSDPAAPTGYRLAYNADPNSPLRWNGPFGPAPRYFPSPLLRTAQAANDAAATILSRYTGLPFTLGLWTTPNPALRPLDTVSAKVTGLAENHLIAEVTIPLAISGAGPVQITTKTVNQVIIPEEDNIPPSTGSSAPTPAQIAQEKAFELTSTAENSTVAWWTQFGYIEDIGDGRGYTGGIFGATSATGDMLEVVQQYVSAKPSNNVLQPFLPGLQTCAAAGMGSTASSLANANLGAAFKTAWAQAATDTIWQTTQINYRNLTYWLPAFNAATADGLSNLGLAIYYDTSINHGPGVANSNDGSFDDIRSRTTGTKPASGGSETTWLTNFLSTRSAVLTAWGDNPADGRIAMFTALLGTANFTLTCPFSWSVYGDSYTMATDPLPYGWTGSGTGSQTHPLNPGQAHNIGSQPGQNSFNVGVGFDGTQPEAFSSYGTSHHDFSRDEIEAGLSISGFYELNANDEVVMTSHPGGGKTSSNTSYSRVEYRELELDGKTKMAFNPSKGHHYIKGRSAADALSGPKPQMVLAQMHDSSDDTAMIYVNNATTIIAKVKGNTVATLDSSYTLGTLKDWMIEVVDGTINFYWDNLTTPKHSEAAFTSTTAGQYFKSGSYMQWNLSNGDATLGKVRLVNLEHWHSQTPLSSTPWPAPARPATDTGGGSTGGGGTTTGTVPAFDHVVVVVLENHDPDAITAGAAPYITSLAAGGALCTDSHGVVHPSQGNYLALFSGSTQGLTDDTGGNPGLAAPSLWSQLGSGSNVKWYSEGKPSDPHSGQSGSWVQWHVAMSYFAGTDSQNLDFSAFPSDFTTLPKVAFVSPNLDDDMHDGSVAAGDSWVQTHLSAYATWAKTHNSLLVVTFDESADDTDTNNPVYTLFYGAKVQSGITVSRRIDHYDVLRTIEAVFGLPGIGNAANRSPIIEAFTGTTTGGGGGSTGGTGGTGGSGADGVETAKLLGWGNPIDGDEFEYSGPPNSKWSMYDGPGHDGNGIRSPSAFNVANGILTCTGDNVNGGTTGGMSFARSSKLWRVEWRVRLYSINPNGSGNRYHAVLILWPTSDAWPQGGEDDFYECDAEDGAFTAYIHIPGNDGSAQHAFEKIRSLDLQNWHNIAYERTSSKVTCWIDGQQAFQITSSDIQIPGPMQPTYQLDNFFGNNMQPAKFEAQWFRIYNEPS